MPCLTGPGDLEAGPRSYYQVAGTWKTALLSKRVRVLALLCLLLIGVQFLARNLAPLSFARTPVASNTTRDSGVDWSRFAYAQYTTDEAYLCNALMVFETLQRLETKPDRILLYPNSWSIDVTPPDSKARMLLKARDEFRVKLRPITVIRESRDLTWGSSFTKLLAFNQTDYQRVLSIDSDSTILQSMDELFLLPHAPVAMPRAYWLDNTLSSTLMLIEPSRVEFSRIETAIKEKGQNDFDMEIVNTLYKDHCLVLPHRPYNILSGEFRGTNHSRYLGSEQETWDPEKVLAEAKLVHFSDWPYPKPWIEATDQQTEERMPECTIVGPSGEEDCRAQKIWLWLYEDFRQRRKKICGEGV
ncbi:hypothetical protein VTO42DRAFT_7963 [Malbranchea cinnamomea]